ncbi:MAG: hypothetical protein AAFZ15_02400 [Bacteroidota bacterium]
MALDTGQTDVVLDKIAEIRKWANKRLADNKKKVLLGQLDLLENAYKAGPAPKEGEVDFADFLADIGDSVVDTQRKLDQQSMAYLEETKSNKQITPAIYRIPKVKANIKFGMRSIKQKGFNIIVAQQRQEDERMLNQSLDFEIISVPPPPDFQQSLSAEVPGIGFIFSMALRDAIFDAIDVYQPTPAHPQPGLNKQFLTTSRKQVLILQVGPPMVEGMDDYLLLAANDKAAKNVGIWYLRMDPTGEQKTVLEIILKFSADDRKGENYQMLQKLILAQSAKQARLIR